ncbi:MAG: NUDIX hydrolase [Actinomycetota bacterium]|nr:NUDIX hydrolase [Rubrobacter sp.]MDQ3509684.1 NUDIX hydrolase [Actinomycetota bacterium]
MTVRADLVSVMLPVREDGKVLLLQRPEGTWDPPGGRLASGETFEDGVIRELYEETGLLAAPERMLATWVGEAGGKKLAAVTYIGRVGGADNEVRLSDEHLGSRWATPSEWLDLQSWWSVENRRRAAAAINRLPKGGLPAPPPPKVRPDSPPVEAMLGAGSVLVDMDGGEPRALLLRRWKPPTGLWENPGGTLEEGEGFIGCARRETFEETGIEAEPESPWWAKVEPWRSPDDPELYAGVGFISRYPGGEIKPEKSAHDDHFWATEAEWRSLRTWYTEKESDTLWKAIRGMSR